MLTCTTQTAAFSGTIGPGSTAFVATGVTGNIAIGQEILTGAGVSAGTTIASGSLVSTTFTGTVNNSQTVGPVSMTSGTVIPNGAGFLVGCFDTTHSYSVGSGGIGNQLDLQTVTVGSNATLVYLKAGAVVTSP